ncbi:hypothetical protein H7K38_03530 [Mycobacterium alsense]|uniref:Uncharacterized protein n=1 Tax=Mycobacterium alsense TaxID=324058 RepID=A0AA41XKI5_9MYCO|nr:hypothetical protein [Mycobacterium alsense]MCV7377720.1 hypothetical protein [Mycobacterium alsense]
MKTIFSRSENQHPAVPAAYRRGLTSGDQCDRAPLVRRAYKRGRAPGSRPRAAAQTLRPRGSVVRLVTGAAIDQPTESCNSIGWK